MFFVLFIGFCLTLWSSELARYDLRVKVHDIRTQTGFLEISLYDESRQFPHNPRWRYYIPKAAFFSADSTYCFKNLPVGVYAFAVHDDSNGDKKMNKNWLGMPQEGYSFYKLSSLLIAPPSFKRFSFKVDTTTYIETKMLYP